MHTIVHAFYHFVAFPDYREWRDPLLHCCEESGLKGTILLAEEGINGTVEGTAQGLDAMWALLHSDPRFAGMTPKASTSHLETFYRMKVRLKKEIVSLGVAGIDPTREVGTYVAPEDWNELISDPAVYVVDTRNDYEVEVGQFQGAQNPCTPTFRDFPAFVDQHLDPKRQKKVAMYCTGGIRCEKATAYLLRQGFEEVYHLQGGILNYLERIPPEQSKWMGECFVFDNRVTVDHRLTHGGYTTCFACRRPLHEEDTHSPLYERGVSCAACHGKTSADKKERARERERQMNLAEARNQRHLGIGASPTSET